MERNNGVLAAKLHYARDKSRIVLSYHLNTDHCAIGRRITAAAQHLYEYSI